MTYPSQKKPLVIVDIDGVLFNTPVDAVIRANLANSTKHTVTDIFDFDAVHDKTKFIVNGVDQFHAHQHAPEQYTVVNGAQEALEHFRESQFLVIALTSRNVTLFRETTKRALEKYFGLGPKGLIQDVIFAGDPELGKHAEKGEIIQKIGGNILIDDAVRYCRSAEKFRIPAILFAQPYNLTGHDWPTEKTAHGWPEAVELTKRLINN